MRSLNTIRSLVPHPLLHRVLLVGTALGTCLACSASGEDPEPDLAEVSQKIYGDGAHDDWALDSACTTMSAVGALHVLDAAGGSDVFCSGTLVSPTKVVSAWHCFDPDPHDANGPVHFALPAAQQGGYFGPVIDVSVAPYHPANGEWGADDLVVLTLDVPVPRHVANPLPVLTSDTAAHLGSGALSVSPATIIGWGGNVKYDSGAGKGVRRVGTVNPSWHRDTCGDLCEGTCNDVPYWREGNLNPSGHSMHAKGDSGGALVGMFQTVPHLIGVISGWYKDNYWCNQDEGQVAASTGGVEPEIETWFASALAESRTFSYPVHFGVTDLAVYATDTLRLNDRVQVQELAGGWGTVAVANPTDNVCPGSFWYDSHPTRVGTDVTMGNLYVASNFKFEDRTVVVGNGWFEGTVTWGHGSGVGTLLENYRMQMPSIALNPPFPAARVQVPIVEPGQVLPIADSSHTIANLSVHPGGVAQLQCGQNYYFDRLQLESNSRLEIDTSCGPVRVFVSQGGWIRGRVVDTDQTVRGDILFGLLQTSAFSVAQSPEGTIVAPNGQVTLQTGGYVGAVLGKKVEVHQGSIVRHVPFTYPWI